MLVKLLQAPYRYKTWKPSHLLLVVNDMFGVARQPVRGDGVHLRALLNWLGRAQDTRNGKDDEGSIAAGWSFEDGWLPGYPETSGYIIETFLAAAKHLQSPALRQRAERIVDWELSIQNANGSFPGHFGEPGSTPVIFNTGQITHGMVAAYQEFGRADCLEAMVKAGRWMVDCQDNDGCWRRNVHNGVVHTYNTRAAWALLRVGLLANQPDYVAAARSNIDWALTQQTESGWFESNGFVANQVPFLHTIAYAIRGILECGVILEHDRYLDAARKAAKGLASQQRADGYLAGTFADGWVAGAEYCCLTGLAQTVLIWQRLDQLAGSRHFRTAINKGLSYLKRNHRLIGNESPQDGGLAGSAPIWGDYSRFEFPNWAAKFFADALIVEMSGAAVPAPLEKRH